MSLALFAGIPVGDLEAARPWYERLLGEVAFAPNDEELVWELAENRSIYIVQDPERAGRALVTVFCEDLDSVAEEIAGRGLEPAESETYGNGVRKLIYRDPEGNEVGFGGAPS
jgi:hypothetical protein